MSTISGISNESLLGCAQLGAEVADAPSEATTHVVAARDRTDKVLWARQHARHAVSPLWLQSCGARARQLWPRLGGLALRKPLSVLHSLRSLMVL